MHTTINENFKTTPPNCDDKFGWSAIIAGALVGIGTSFLLNLFALAIGITAFIYTDTVQTFAIGGFIALAIIAIVSMGSLGWVSGYLGAKSRISCLGHSHYHEKTCHLGCIYGFVAWCLALILTIFLSAHVGKFLSLQRVVISHPNYVIDTQKNWQSRPVSMTKPTTNHQNAPINIKTDITDEETAKTFAMTTFVTFILFLIGALSAVFAGHCGFNHCAKHTKEHL